MKRFYGVILTVVIVMSGLVQAAPDWNDRDVIQLNTEQPHATMTLYHDAKSALSDDPSQSLWLQSLNGPWKFKWSKNPGSRPVRFSQSGFDDSGWNTINVPSNWQIEGYGTPIYQNSGMVMPVNMPHAPMGSNPIGSYRRTFQMPDNWAGRKVFIHFAGVNSAFYIWVNGGKVGYSQGSRTPAEWDITKYLKPGENLIAVEVYRFSDGSYFEDQDFWRLSGIFRDVYLYSTADQHIRDFVVVTDLDEEYVDAELKVDVEVLNPDGTVELDLLDGFKKSVKRMVSPASEKTVFIMNIENPLKWSAEHSDLYTLFITLKDAKGRTLEVIPQQVGFREVEIQDEAFLLNGKQIVFKGVNRHEHHPDTGHVVDRGSMMRDIVLFKQNNINAVRTSHYANDPEWLKLCSKYGIYVMGEANVETHFAGNNPTNVLANDPKWKEQLLDRQRRMVLRDRNEPSIIVWSMGNESGDGPNFGHCIDWIHEADPTRSVHYEGSGGIFGNGAPNSDWASSMYSPPGKIAQAGKPFVLCEYSHAMGNSNGNLDLYWDHINTTWQHHGGFVWDWMDQGIRMPVPDGFSDPFGRDAAMAYGGFWSRFMGEGHAVEKQYGNPKGNFCMNGLVAADQTPRPGLKAIKRIYQNIIVQPADLRAGKILIRNRYDFTNLKDLVDGQWRIVSEDQLVAKGSISSLDIEPGTEKEVSLDLPVLAEERGREYFLDIEFTMKNDAFFAQSGYLLASEQFRLHNYRPAAEDSLAMMPSLDVNEYADVVEVRGKDFSLIFDKRKGMLTSYRYEGEELLISGPRLDLWRARIDNDRGAEWRKIHPEDYRYISRDAEITDVKVSFKIPMEARIICSAELKTGDWFDTEYRIYGSGEVAVKVSFYKRSDNSGVLYRYGTKWTLPAGFESMTWYGRGPDETYSDRKFEPVGIYSGTIDEQWTDYARPQENGNKSDVRWAAFQNSDGVGLLFKGVQPLNVGASHFSADAMEEAQYTFELRRNDNLFINIDLAQQGVGGDNSWAALPHEQYMLPLDDFSYSYHFQPFKKMKQADLAELGRTFVGTKRTFSINLPKITEEDLVTQ